MAIDGWTIGIIGGSGLYALDEIEDAIWHDVETPWGRPSDRILEGRIGATRLLFLPRHGQGHAIPPTEINARANIDALKRLGATDILAISSVGSLREDRSTTTSESSASQPRSPSSRRSSTTVEVATE